MMKLWSCVSERRVVALNNRILLGMATQLAYGNAASNKVRLMPFTALTQWEIMIFLNTKKLKDLKFKHNTAPSDEAIVLHSAQCLFWKGNIKTTWVCLSFEIPCHSPYETGRRKARESRNSVEVFTLTVEKEGCDPIKTSFLLFLSTFKIYS